MPLILKAAGQRIYTRSGTAAARVNMEGFQNWTYLKDRSEVANSFVFDFPEPCLADGSRYIPGPRDEILVYKSEADYGTDTRWFGGLLTSLTDRSLLTPGGYQVSYNLQAQAFDILLDKELRQPTLANMTWENLLKFLVQRHFAGQLDPDVSNIVNPGNAPPVKINNGTMRDLLRAMRNLTGYDFTVDAYRKLHVFKAEDHPAPFTLNDSISGILAFDSKLDVRTESRQIFNLVRQPFRNLTGVNDWDGEFFTGKGDTKGTGGQLPLLRTLVDAQDAVFLDDTFDGATIDPTLWTETDDTGTHHPDFPNQGYLFPANGQCQVIGGTGTLGGVALASSEFYAYLESSYLIQEFQLTNATGDGYIGLFTDGAGLATGNFKAGLRVLNGALKALDGTTLIASLDITVNYLFWIIQTASGWQYDIYGGEFATRQTIRTETGVTHLTDYVLAPIVNKNLECSINSVRYQTNLRGIVVEIDGVKKTVGLEGSSTDLPDIDAYLNTDETPAVLKFRAAEAIVVIATVTDATHIILATGQGSSVEKGHRLVICAVSNPADPLDGREAFVSAVSGDNITLVSPGLSGMSNGQLVLVNTTIPAKDAKVNVKYPFERQDEAVVRDEASIWQFGTYPLTLQPNDVIRDFSSAQQQAQANLERFKTGILRLAFTSNEKLVDEPDSLMALSVNLTRRPDPIVRTVTIQRVTVTASGNIHRYQIDAESADPVKPLDDLVKGRNLVIGTEGDIQFTMSLADEEVMDGEDITVHEVASLYITLGNPEHRRLGEFRLKP